VDDRDANRICPDHSGVDEGISTRRGCGVQTGYKVFNGAVGGRVIFDFTHPGNIRIDRSDHAYDLVSLASEFRWGFCAARSRETSAQTITVEIIQNVEAGDCQRAADGIGRSRPRVIRGEADRTNRLHAVNSEPLIQHSGQPAAYLITDPQSVKRAQTTRWIKRRVDVLIVVG